MDVPLDDDEEDLFNPDTVPIPASLQLLHE